MRTRGSKVDRVQMKGVRMMEVSIGVSPMFTGKTAKRILELSEKKGTSLNASYMEECKENAKKNGWVIKKRR